MLCVKLKFAKCHPGAQLPTQNQGDVGFDLRSKERVELSPGKVTVVHVGIQIADVVEVEHTRHDVYGDYYEPKPAVVPFLKVEGRSGLASKGIFPVGGILDPSYRGEIGAIMFNSTDKPFVFEPGDRIAQLVCYLTFANDRAVGVSVEEAEVVLTARGNQGFGSSGR